jgi:hypothetical protein
MLDFTAEQPIPLASVCGMFPGRKDRLNFSTVWRWVLHGVRGANGALVRLEGARVGGRWLTTREALARFQAALTPDVTEPSGPAPGTPRQANKASVRAGAELEAKRA